MTGEPSLRDRIIGAAAALTAERGWDDVTMGRLAATVGVSRQTVYNEVGTKPELAEAVVLAELAKFLVVVQESFAQHPHDPVAVVHQAARAVLVMAADNPLVQAVAAGAYGATSGLLPLITTQSQPVLETAAAVVRTGFADYDLPMSDAQVAALSEELVRLILSHLTEPSRSPEDVADFIAWALAPRLTGRWDAGPGPRPGRR